MPTQDMTNAAGIEYKNAWHAPEQISILENSLAAKVFELETRCSRFELLLGTVLATLMVPANVAEIERGNCGSLFTLVANWKKEYDAIAKEPEKKE